MVNDVTHYHSQGQLSKTAWDDPFTLVNYNNRLKYYSLHLRMAFKYGP